MDEISNLPFRLQAKFLRVLQEREVRRIGETTPRSIDIQVVAATNKDLMEEIRKGRFRKDLYYRLRAMQIWVPPLRARSDDIPLLIEWFLDMLSKAEKGRSKAFTNEAKETLRNYYYPGNIRELKNIVDESYYSSKGKLINADELPPEVRRVRAVEVPEESAAAAARLYHEITENRGDFEQLIRKPFQNHEFGSSVVRGVIEKALRDSGGNYRDAFARLRIPDQRYSLTMKFLKRTSSFLDYRPFRRDQRRSRFQ